MATSQHDIVIRTLQRLGGVASLAELYRAVPRAGWATRTPDATIRRIVQTEPRIYRIKPGLYALVAKRHELDAKALVMTRRRPPSHSSEPTRAPYIATRTQAHLVMLTLERLGGIASLAQLYREVPTRDWKTRTPTATIRRIVQLTPGIYKLRPGLYGLTSRRSEFEAQGIIAETARNQNSPELLQFNHSYYQGVLLRLGNWRGYECWSPNQDRNKPFQNTALGAVRTLQELPRFSHQELVRKSSTVDVIWFNQRLMPQTFFEVEHSTDIYNSLRKFAEFQDFSCEMVVVADTKRRAEFERKKQDVAFRDVRERVAFLSYRKLITSYEQASQVSDDEFQI